MRALSSRSMLLVAAGLLLQFVVLGSAEANASRLLTLEGAELGPFAYTHFCVRYPDECKLREPAATNPGEVDLTPARRAELFTVNTAVNRGIAPAQHAGRGTYDTWTIAPPRGDCNDYAVTKRHELLMRGWPSRALLLAEVVTSWGDHHLVLVARSRAGDFVLDNLSPQVRDWTAPDYQWLRAQMPSEPALWARVVAPSRDMASRSAPTGDDHSAATD